MINYISKPFRWFFKLEAASGLVLLFAAIIALFISNSGLADLYFATLNKYLFIGINNFGLKLSVLHWINDALMAIFFFFKQKTAYEIASCLVGSEMCIRDSNAIIAANNNTNPLAASNLKNHLKGLDI